MKKGTMCLWAGLVVLLWGSMAQAASSSATLRLFLAGQSVSKTALTRILWQQPLTPRLLRHKTYLEIRFLRNALYAVKQARFRSPDLQAFYSKQRWYNPRRSAGAIRLSPQARRNVKLLWTLQAAAKQRWLKQVKKRQFGKKPMVAVSGGLLCFGYLHYRVVQSYNSIGIAHQKTGAPCTLKPQKIVLRKNRSRWGFQFRGIIGHFAFLSRIGGSDYIDFRVLNLKTGKLAYKKDSLNPLSNVTWDDKNSRLLLNLDIRVPKRCGNPLKASFNKSLRTCWPFLQKKHPSLQKTQPPVCRCPPGLGRYVIVQHELALKNSFSTPVMLKKAGCGCSS